MNLKFFCYRTVNIVARYRHWLAATLGMSALLACAPVGTPINAEATAQPESCIPAAMDEPLVGNWLSVASQKGVAGAVRTLYTLKPDGSMDFIQQVKRSQSPSQGIYETGCWLRQGQSLTLKTYESNGLPVNYSDPIYTNNYTIKMDGNDQLIMDSTSGQVSAKRMSDGYRLPF